VPSLRRAPPLPVAPATAYYCPTTTGDETTTTRFVTHDNFLRPYDTLGYRVPVPLAELDSVAALQGRWTKILELPLAA
jgi:hypothetical protein